ncbi:Leucine zipper transcription factor-like protein 1, partial [Entophlyctis luteolus]
PIKGFYYSDPGKQYQTDSYFSAQMQTSPYAFYTSSNDIVSLLPSSAGNSEPAIFSRNYGVGDFLVVQYTDVPAYGVLPLPAPSVSSECNDANPAKFLVSEHTKCNRILPIGAAPDICMPGASFDVSYFLSGYTLITGPSSTLQLNGSSCISPESGSSVLCNTIAPSWNTSTSVCENIMVSLDLTFTYSVGTSSVGIVNVQVNAGFQNLEIPTGVSVAVMQKFSIAWVPANQDSEAKSGNPGYIRGAPVRFGTTLSTPAPAVAYFPETEYTLTLPRDALSSDGTAIACTSGSGSGARVSITFGDDTIAGCTLFLTYDSLADSTKCATVRATAYAALTGGSGGPFDTINVVGMFGNSSPSRVAEWVPIILDSQGDA